MTAPLSLRTLDDAPPVSLAEARERAARVVSGRTGIVTSVELSQADASAPSLYWARSYPADASALVRDGARNDGNAAALDVDRAVVKALGESIERYSAAFWDDDALQLAPYAELKERAIHPTAWALFSREQTQRADFPVTPFTEGVPLRWARGFSLTQDRSTLVPAAFVYIPYRLSGDEARIIPWQVSTGLACHTSLAWAALKALLEVVERDAFMLFWHRGIRCPTVDLERLPQGELGELVARARATGYGVEARLLTLDLPIPIVFVALTHREATPYVVMGCAADCRPETAMRLALEEALLSLHGITMLSDRTPKYTPEAADYADITSLLQHPWLYAVEPGLREVMAAQLEPSCHITLDEVRPGHTGSAVQQLRWLVDELRRIELEAIVVDLTTEDVDDIGFKVVRGIVPGMQPLDVDHRIRHLGGRRLYRSPHELGVDEGRIRLSGNPYPHPFP